MINLDIKCLRCGVAMEPGYLMDRGHGNAVNVATWVGGAPDVRWYGIRAKGHDQARLAAYRCGTCGVVELRAVSERADDAE